MTDDRHLTKQEKANFVYGISGDAGKQRVKEHCSICQDCRNRILGALFAKGRYDELRELAGPAPQQLWINHPPENIMAAFIDHNLPQEETQMIYLHLADCNECLDWLLNALEAQDQASKSDSQ